MHRQAAVFALCATLLSACERVVYHDADEARANRIVSWLDEAGIGAEKSRDAGRDGGWAVSVQATDETAAYRVLQDHSLELAAPVRGPGEASLIDALRTPAQERAELRRTREAELARTLRALPHVVDAAVHLSAPVSKRDPSAAVTAAVYLKVADDAAAPDDRSISTLVSAAVDGLGAADVAVLRTTTEPRGAVVTPLSTLGPVRIHTADLGIARTAVAGWGLLLIVLATTLAGALVRYRRLTTRGT